MARYTATNVATAAADPVRPGIGEGLFGAYQLVRACTEEFCEPLRTEDYVIQSMPDVSPAKWHLAHTTWFFERFILQEHRPGYEPVNEQYYYLFNSYYNAIGPQHCRPNRGVLSRPTVEEVFAYRRTIDERMRDLLVHADDALRATLAPLLTLGLQHEQQHQELMVTDFKHVLSSNPMLPAYREESPVETQSGAAPARADWVRFAEGVYDIGANVPANPTAFVFDNETPRHRVFLEPFQLASRLVTNADYLAFIEDGGYERPELWLSLGWATVNAETWRHPLYWFRDRGDGGPWMQYTMHGPREVDRAEPACHLSLFEADAFARWSGARLPTEAEWELAASTRDLAGHFADARRFHPDRVPPAGSDELAQLYGDVWEWTSSSYEPYPGFQLTAGALGEYNAKFMCNQYVLRGGSCATPAGHVRPTYRNFFPPEARWQFSGVRLARDA